jgi:hypothetical protein
MVPRYARIRGENMSTIENETSSLCCVWSNRQQAHAMGAATVRGVRRRRSNKRDEDNTPFQKGKLGA